MPVYQLTASSTIIRLRDGASIPADPGNSDYMEYLQWKNAGGVPDAAPAPDPAIAAEVARRASLAADGQRASLLAQLKPSTAAQIRSYVQGLGITDPVAAALFTKILLLIALDLRQ